MFDRILHARPKAYGFFYLGLIPFYAAVFYFFPKTLGENYSFMECVYFSTVTITTLGYGDIVPSGDLGRFVSSSESILGVVLIGLFLNSLSRVRSETTRAEDIEKEQKSYRDTQVAKLNGHFSIIRPIIEIYQRSVIRITSPLVGGPHEYNADFAISDMKDLFGPSVDATRNFHEPAVRFYFDSLDRLHSELSDLIKSVDLRLFPELETSCISFIQAGVSLDFSEPILGAVNTRVGDESMADLIKRLLEKFEGEPVLDQVPPMLTPYVALYRQIQCQMEFIEIFKKELERGMSAR